MSKQIILTGIRANNVLTLGNYIGAIQPMVQMQKVHGQNYQINMFVPDLHSITTPIDYSTLQDNIIKNLGVFVASGLDIYQPNTFVYRQSYIPAHSEMAWLLSCFTGFGEASRMTEFKDKATRLDNDDRVSVGLFNYPILMSGDILLYNATYVPVGEDQRQHLELCRDLAMRINNLFQSDIFVVPKTMAEQVAFINRDSAPRIRSLKNPDKKMSKSISDPAGTIELTDSPKEASKKIMSATTDSVGQINFDWQNQPGITNLLQIAALLSQTPQEEINQRWIGETKYGDLKKFTANIVEQFLTEFQSNMNSLDYQTILQQVQANEAIVAKTANQTLLKLQQAIGLR